MVYISVISLPLSLRPLFKSYGLWCTPMNFGVYLRGAQTYPRMLELAKAAEELDYYKIASKLRLAGAK